MKIIIKSFPIRAGMPLNGQGSNRIKTVGKRTVKFIYTDDECLVSEKIIKIQIY